MWAGAGRGVPTWEIHNIVICLAQTGGNKNVSFWVVVFVCFSSGGAAAPQTRATWGAAYQRDPPEAPMLLGAPPPRPPGQIQKTIIYFF